MSEDHQVPYWIQVFQTYYKLYGGSLINDHAFNSVDVGVYILLLTQKWFIKKTQFTKNEIFTTLNSIPSNLLQKNNDLKYSEDNVGSSLKKLENAGFVTSIPNTKNASTGGRPPDAFYESTKLTVLKEKIQKRLEIETANIMDSVSRILEMEEGIGLKESNMKGDKNGK